jgi:hypothetical protein
LSRIGRGKVLKAQRDASGIPLKRLDTKGRKAALEVLRKFSPIRYLMARHTRELLRAYHKAGLIDTPIARREPRDIPVELATSERAVADAVDRYISTSYNEAKAEARTAIGFVMTIYNRRLGRTPPIRNANAKFSLPGGSGTRDWWKLPGGRGCG